MGFAGMLIQLGIPYDSEEAVQVAANVMHFINEEAHKASAALAEERGVFPAYEGSKYDVAGGPRLRNASCTTIAPTGTLSLIAGCCNGIEPYYAMAFVRNILEGDQLLEVNPYFEEVAKREGFYSEELLKQLVTHNQLHSLEGIPDRVKRLFVTTHRIKSEWHIRIQAAFQKYTDNAVSKMVNIPREATRENIANIFMMAYKEGLKGATVYRDGSRELQALSTGEVGAELVSKYVSEKGGC